MNFLRLALVTVALALSARAGATVSTYSFAGALNSVAPDVAAYYPEGALLSGTFSIDDAVPGWTYPHEPGEVEVTNHYGAVSGTVSLGSNTITFTSSLAYVITYPDSASLLFLLGGNAWGTGGALSETQPVDGLSLTGFQLSFGFAPVSSDTPITTLLSGAEAASGSFALNFSSAQSPYVVAFGEMTSISAVPEPAAVVQLMTGLFALMMVVAYRRSRQ